MEDTVEKNVEGLAEEIIAADEKTRAEDLVMCIHLLVPPKLTMTL